MMDEELTNVLKIQHNFSTFRWMKKMFHTLCYGPNPYVFKILLIDIYTFLIVTKNKLDEKK